MVRSALRHLYWPFALLIVLPFALQLLPGIPFTVTLLLVAFVYGMRLLFMVWPKRSATGRRYLWGLIPLAWIAGFVAFIVGWWNQPYFGANICLSKGFMWETDFIDVMRPRLIKKVGSERNDRIPEGTKIEDIVSDANSALDIFRQCVAERGLKFCRYVGPNEEGYMMDAYTTEGLSHIAPEDRSRYRYIRTDIKYEMSIVPNDISESTFEFATWRGGSRFATGARMCALGCDCNEEYGFR